MWNPTEHSDDENVMWCWLRAAEWSSWPAFLSYTFGPIALVFFSWPWVFGYVLLINLNWVAFIRYKDTSLRLVNLDWIITLLAWFTCPASALYLWMTGQRSRALLALTWPLVASVVAGIPAPQIGRIQKQYMAALGYESIERPDSTQSPPVAVGDDPRGTKRDPLK